MNCDEGGDGGDDGDDGEGEFNTVGKQSLKMIVVMLAQRAHSPSQSRRVPEGTPPGDK